ncbi:MAG: endonuclease domain-containing protein [Chitinophagaceae bacterium]|nr:endonuclease domain-containing protein [Chitinophagaceae bacterium]
MADFNENLHNNANPSTYEIARILRKQQTKAEELLWLLLRGRKICNLKFRRQHAFENYVLDFYCHEAKLAIEADGRIHDEPNIKAYDDIRTKRLNECGITVLRFTNDEIESHSAIVLNKIKIWANENKPTNK